MQPLLSMEKRQKVADALLPGAFIVLGIGDQGADIIGPRFQSGGIQPGNKRIEILHLIIARILRSAGGAHVHIEAYSFHPGIIGPCIQQRLLGIAQPRIEKNDTAEDAGMIVRDGKRNHPAQRRAADGSGILAGQCAIGAVDHRLEFLDNKPAVESGFAGKAGGGLLEGREFRRAVGRVVDSDDDDRIDLAGLDQVLRRFIHAPFDAGKGGRGIEEILPVLQVQNGITLRRIRFIIRRQVDDDRAEIAQQFGLKLFVQPENAGEGDGAGVGLSAVHPGEDGGIDRRPRIGDEGVVLDVHAGRAALDGAPGSAGDFEFVGKPGHERDRRAVLAVGIPMHRHAGGVPIPQHIGIACNVERLIHRRFRRDGDDKINRRDFLALGPLGVLVRRGAALGIGIHQPPADPRQPDGQDQKKSDVNFIDRSHNAPPGYSRREPPRDILTILRGLEGGFL